MPDDQMIQSLLVRLKADPANVDLADNYWNALATRKGSDTRSGASVVQVYRGAALETREGVVAFARAYRELYEVSGEGPRAAYVDEGLIEALRASLLQVREPERSHIAWILEALGMAA